LNDILDALRQGLDEYEVIPINKENYTDVWGVYATNQKYLQSWGLGKVVEVEDILETFTRLPDHYDADKQIFVGIWRNGQVVAICDLLPQLDGDDNLWLSEIIIHGNEKGGGLGRIIVDSIVKATKNIGLRRITLGCAKNKIDFWSKMGFCQVAHFDEDFIFVRRFDEETN